MSYKDDALGLIFPTRTGGAAGQAIERKMLDAVHDTGGFHTRVLETPEGTVMLKTRGGDPRFYMATTKYEAVGLGTVADFYSGFVSSGVEIKGLLTAFAPAPLSVWKYPTDLPTPWQLYNVRRLAVPSCGLLPSWDMGGIFSSVWGTQYAYCRPYFYTGAMRKLVQFCLGYGIAPLPSWYDKQRPPLAFSDKRPRKSIIEGTTVTVEYGYTFNRSHGVTTAADGRKWIVEISKLNGVLAWPMTYESGTDRPEFRAWLASRNDTEGMLVVDTFGGFPTGNCVTTDIAGAIASGFCLQLLKPDQMALYTGAGALAEQIGWAFSASGQQARVVGTRHVDVPGTQGWEKSQYLALAIQIGATAAEEAGPNKTLLAARLELSLNERRRWKLTRITEAQAATLVTLPEAQTLAAFDALGVNPGVAGTAALSLLAEAPWYARFGALKVWQQYAQLCLSAGYSLEGAPAPADFCVFVYFNGETPVELRWSPAVTNYSGGMYSPGYYDRRGSTAPSRSDSSVDYKRGGPASFNYGWNPANDILMSVYRSVWFDTRRTTVVTVGNYAKTSAWIPCGDRESFIMAGEQGDTGSSTTVASEGLSQIDDMTIIKLGYTGEYYNYPGPTVVTPDGCAVAVTQTGSGYNATWHAYWCGRFETRPGGDPQSPYYYASGAQWLPRCTNLKDVPGAAGIVPDPFDRSSKTTSSPPAGAFNASAVHGGQVSTILEVKDNPSVLYRDYHFWFTTSDALHGQYFETFANCFGPTAAFHYPDNINSGKYLCDGTLVSPLLKTLQPNYIGVV